MSRVSRPAHLGYLWDGFHSVLCLFCQYFVPNTRPDSWLLARRTLKLGSCEWWLIPFLSDLPVATGSDCAEASFQDGKEGEGASTIDDGHSGCFKAENAYLVDCPDKSTVWIYDDGQWGGSRRLLWAIRAETHHVQGRSTNQGFHGMEIQRGTRISGHANWDITAGIHEENGTRYSDQVQAWWVSMDGRHLRSREWRRRWIALSHHRQRVPLCLWGSGYARCWEPRDRFHFSLFWKSIAKADGMETVVSGERGEKSLSLHLH